jgi:hypothetical protein
LTYTPNQLGTSKLNAKKDMAMAITSNGAQSAQFAGEELQVKFWQEFLLTPAKVLKRMVGPCGLEPQTSRCLKTVTLVMRIVALDNWLPLSLEHGMGWPGSGVLPYPQGKQALHCARAVPAPSPLVRESVRPHRSNS